MISTLLDGAVIEITRPWESSLGLMAPAAAVQTCSGRRTAASHATRVFDAPTKASGYANTAWGMAQVSAHAPRHLYLWGSARDLLPA